MKKKVRFSGALLVMVFAVVSPAMAAVEDFNYANGVLNGKDGGSDSDGITWNGAWSGALNHVVTDHADHWDGSGRIARNFGQTGDSSALISEGLVYISYDFSSSTALAENSARGVEIYNQQNSTASTDRFMEIGEAYNPASYGVTLRGYDFDSKDLVDSTGAAYTYTSTLSGVDGTYVYLESADNPVLDGTTVNHIVVSYDIDANVGDIFMKFWIDPTAQELSSGTGYNFAAKVYEGFATSSMGGVGFGGYNASLPADFAVYDNLTFEIVPEPMTSILIGVGGIWILRKRRK